MKRQTIFTLIALIAMLFGLAGTMQPAAAAPGDVVLTIPIVNVALGGTATVPVQITSLVPTRGYQLYITFDYTKVRVNSVADGGFYPGCASTNMPTVANGGIDNATGIIRAANCSILGGADTPASSGVLLNMNVTALGGASGKANFGFPAVPPAPTAQLPKIYGSSGASLPDADITRVLRWLQIGPAASLSITSISFNPPSGSPNVSATVRVTNTGAGAMDPGDVNVFSWSMTNSTPSSGSFNVSGLAGGAFVDVPLGPFAVTGSQATLSVTEPIYGLNSSLVYFASVSDVKGVDVDARFDVFIILNTTQAINFNPLALGPNTQPGTMNVESNAQEWTVAAAATNAWQMAEWNLGFIPGGYELHDTMSVGTQKGVTLSANGLLIPDGVVENQTADLGENYNLTYSQTLHTYDAAVSPNSYHLVVTYTAAVSLAP